MNQEEIAKLAWRMARDKEGTDESAKAVLDYFVQNIESQIQTTLTSKLMLSYSQASKQLETRNKELVKSDENRREAQEIAKLGSWEMYLDTKELWWSDTMYDVLGVEPGVKPAFSVHRDMVHQEDVANVMKVYYGLSEGVLPSSDLQYRLHLHDGQIKWLNSSFRLELDANGHAISYRGVVQDITESKIVQRKLQRYNTQLENLVQEKVDEISNSQMATIYALVRLAESRDDDTGDHIGRTSEYCRLIAQKLWEGGHCLGEIDQSFIDAITKASPLHDIGKVGIPDAILIKPGPLTHDEFEIMKTHTTIGYETLADVERKGGENQFIKIGMEITLCHHERWDGSGYPRGLKGTAIPTSARIMALSDVYDALRSKRVYKDSFDHEKTMRIIKEGRGKHFDPMLIELFLQYHELFAEIFDNRVVHKA